MIARQAASNDHAGVHSRFNMSRQISPVSKFTFGWNIFSHKQYLEIDYHYSFWYSKSVVLQFGRISRQQSKA